ncbi:MAG: hypothetical protein NT157_04380, partial [Candidatus Micrarchaeota archaeon]|nr:hypothetical protein [Candidatus Micrarchaeota archaeon]
SAILLSSKFDMSFELALISEAQSLLQLSSAYLSQNEHGEAIGPLANASSLIANSSSSIRSKALEWASSLESALPAYSQLQSEIGKKAQSLSSMAQITETRVKGSKYEPPFSIDSEVQRALSASSHVKNLLDSLRSSEDKASFVSQKAGNLVIAEQELESLKSTLALLNSEISSLEKSARSSYRNAELALKQLAEAAPATEQLAKEESALRDYLQDSDKAIQEERYADSILLSSYVQSRASKLISASQPAAGGGFDPTLLLIPLSLVFIAVLAYLFVRRKGPPEAQEPRVLKRRKSQAEPGSANNGI